MLKPVQSPNLRLPFRIALGIAVCAFPFTLPLLRGKHTDFLSRSMERELFINITDEPIERHEQRFIYIWRSLWEWIDSKKLPRLDDDLTFDSFQIEPIEPLQSLPRRETVINDLLAQIASRIENWEDYPVTDADRDFVRNPWNFNHELTMTIVKHKNYVIQGEDIKIYEAKRKSMFAKGLELNPEFKEALQKFSTVR